jgi:hypothetical protein
LTTIIVALTKIFCSPTHPEMIWDCVLVCVRVCQKQSSVLKYCLMDLWIDFSTFLDSCNSIHCWYSTNQPSFYDFIYIRDSLLHIFNTHHSRSFFLVHHFPPSFRDFVWHYHRFFSSSILIDILFCPQIVLTPTCA